MCFLAVALLSVISHLAAGQGWPGQGMQGVGTQQNAGWGVGTQQNAGWGVGTQQNAGWGVGTQQNAGWGVGTQQNAGWGVGAWGTGTGVGTGAIGTGVGIGGTGTGVWPGFTRPVNPYYNTTITCAFTETTATGSVTIKRMPQQWGWGGRSNQLTGSLVVQSTSLSGTLSVVVTERSRAESTCSTDGLGPIVGSRPSNPWGSRWGRGSQWNQWGSQTQSNGVLTTITATPGTQTTVDLSSASFPYRSLESFAGRSLALCTTIGESMGQHVCTSIAACCTLGYDNMDAVTP